MGGVPCGLHSIPVLQQSHLHPALQCCLHGQCSEMLSCLFFFLPFFLTSMKLLEFLTSLGFVAANPTVSSFPTAILSSSSDGLSYSATFSLLNFFSSIHSSNAVAKILPLTCNIDHVTLFIYSPLIY